MLGSYSYVKNFVPDKTLYTALLGQAVAIITAGLNAEAVTELLKGITDKS